MLASLTRASWFAQRALAMPACACTRLNLAHFVHAHSSIDIFAIAGNIR